MDGRVQLPVIEYLIKRFNVEYVDVISEPGPNLILAKQTNFNLVESIFERLKISVNKHNSVGIAIVGHHDCAGNPSSKEEQITHLRNALECVRERYSRVEVICLWVDEEWKVHELSQEDMQKISS